MVAILNVRITIQFSLKSVPKGSIGIGNKPALVQVMVWCRTDDKQLSEALLNQFTDAYMRGELNQNPLVD